VPDLGAAREDQEIVFGVAACKCREYPVVSGILIFKEMKSSKTAVDAIKAAKTDRALEKTAMMFMGERFVSFALNVESLLHKFLRKKPSISFWKLASFIENSPFATYAKHRFSCPSLISAMPFFPVIKVALSGGGRILDLGCGMGHLSYLMSRQFGAKNIFCADISFRGLYFARRFLVGPDAGFILLDANAKFPFVDKCFKAVISMDALPFIEDKNAVAEGIRRILTEDGLVLFVHIHNKLVLFIANGLPLTPEGYRGLFDQSFEARLFSEKYLMDSFFERKTLDLSQVSDMKIVNSSDAISMVFSRDRKYFSKYGEYFTSMPNPMRVVSNEKFILNPLYRKRKGKYVRVFPAARYEEEYYLIGDFFPETVDPGLPDEELKRRLVLIPVPENYMKKNEQLNYVRFWR
jgi:SAM-dependent methyltransferase